jgi:PAS domain S-box-containing protein
MDCNEGVIVSRLFEALNTAADGAFVTDDSLRIVHWNKAAEEILGFERGKVTGQYCYQILQGIDEEKRLLCQEHCRVAELVLNAEPASNYDVRVRSGQGERYWLNMSVFNYRMAENGYRDLIVHLFRDVTPKKEDERLFHRLLEAARDYGSNPSHRRTEEEDSFDVLTPREREILNLMIEGRGTREMSQILSISPNTVRNHVQNILQKFNVHTRLEAVSFAIKQNLIE